MTLTREASNARKREAMRKRRADPVIGERIRAQHRVQYGRRRGKQAAYYRDLKLSNFFEWRARLFNRCGTKHTAADLRALWDAQGGLCALTGRPLSPTAQLDHKVPVSRGGGHGLANMRWVAKEANLAKRDLTDAEFLRLCTEVIVTLVEDEEAAP